MRYRPERLLIAAGLLLSGCISLSDYADPQATGKIPSQAQNWGAGTVSNGAKLTLGRQTDQAGTFIVVAGNDPILKEAVAANDRVWVDIEHPLLGDCKLQMKVNGSVVEEAASKIGAYRAYFVPDEKSDHPS